MSLVITEAGMAELHAHARETYPDECCGMIVLRNGREDVVRVTNIQDELHAKDPAQFPRSAATAYSMRWSEIEPLLEAAYRGEIILHAVYHSHPEHDAYFSAHDRAAALNWLDDPNYAAAGQVVISVRNGAVAVTKAFRCDIEAREFVEEPLEIRR